MSNKKYIRGFPKKYFVAVFVERMGVFLRHNNILIDVLTTSAPYVSAPSRQPAEPSTKALHRVCHCKIQRHLPFHRCCAVVLWLRENLHALLLHVATSFSFPSLAVMPFGGFIWRIFGETPEKYITVQKQKPSATKLL